jgi:hypothetical protein
MRSQRRIQFNRDYTLCVSEQPFGERTTSGSDFDDQ